MNLLVVGAGSTGGYFGARLVEAGRDVTFLVRPGRAAHIAKHGLEIVSPCGDAVVRPKLATATDLKGTFDVILVTVKGYSLAQAIDDFAPAVGPETVIVPVLNGMRHIDTLSERFGHRAVAGGLCRITATLDDEGRVIHLSGLHDLVYGELDGSVSPRMQAVHGLFDEAGFSARLSTDIRREMWEKWMLLAALGAMTCLMRGSVGEIVAAPGGRQFALDVIDEVVAIIRAAGGKPGEAALEWTRAMLTEEGSAFTSSMYRDLVSGHPIEAEEIVGDLVERGRQAGVVTPLLSAANTHLAIYAARR